MNDHESKQEARRARLLGAADKADQEGNAAFAARQKIAGHIPLGQPVLVGHHSEGRHRRDIKRMDSQMRKSVEASERAKDLRAKAAAVGTGGISVNDPEAVQKLRAELQDAEALQVRMKDANAAIRKHAKAGPEAQTAALIELGFKEGQAAQLLKPDFCGGIGFPSYALTNNGANIRRIQTRINQVAAVQSADEVEQQIGDITYRESDARVWLVFPGKPSDEVRATLRSHGFKWSPSRNAWVRQLTNAARYYGRKIATDINDGA